MKKWIAIVIVIAVIATVGVGIWHLMVKNSTMSKISESDPEQMVLKGPHIIYTVSSTSIGNYLPLVGRVTANVYNVGSLVSGQITNVYVHQGQLVKKGQLLIKVGHVQYQLNYQQALNNYYKAVLSQDASSIVRQYKLALQVAQQNLNYTRITSPATGFVQTLDVATGDFVTVRQQTVTIVQNTDMWIDAYVNEVDLSDVHTEQKALIFFPQLNNLRLTGMVSFVSPFAVTQSGLTVIPIRISFNKSPLKYGVIYGLDCNVNLILKVSKGVLIPSQAVFSTKNGRKYVLLKTKSGYEESVVQLGKTIGTMVEVIKGVKDGDKLVIRVPQQFQTQEKKHPFGNVLNLRKIKRRK